PARECRLHEHADARADGNEGGDRGRAIALIVEVASISRIRTARVRTLAIHTAVGLFTGAVLIAVFLRLVNVSAVYQRLGHLEIGFALLSGVAFLGAY